MSIIIKLIPTHGKRVFVKTSVPQKAEDVKPGQKPKVTTTVQLLENINDAAAYVEVKQKEEKCEVWDYTGEFFPTPKKK